jgi:hypothetical protein
MDQARKPHPPDERPAGEPTPKKPYVTPRLVKHGSVRELSLGNKSVLNDAGRGHINHP